MSANTHHATRKDALRAWLKLWEPLPNWMLLVLCAFAGIGAQTAIHAGISLLT